MDSLRSPQGAAARAGRGLNAVQERGGGGAEALHFGVGNRAEAIDHLFFTMTTTMVVSARIPTNATPAQM